VTCLFLQTSLHNFVQFNQPTFYIIVVNPSAYYRRYKGVAAAERYLVTVL